MNIVGLDLGRRNVKLFNGHKYISFPSVVGEWRDLKLDYIMDKRGFDVEFLGEKSFVGTTAEDESEFARQMLVEDKATPDALILALTALHQTQMTDLDVITGVPVNLHDTKNKQALVDLLQGSWEIKVKGVLRKIHVHRVRVSVEGGGAFWSNPFDGLVRIIDGGSKTFNYITIKNRVFVDKGSGTLTFGFDTNKSTDTRQLITRVAGELGKVWGAKDKVLAVGGNALEIVDHITPYFPNAEVLQPQLLSVENEDIDLNLFANAIGYYNIGRTVK